jgi:hypothetical protein
MQGIKKLISLSAFFAKFVIFIFLANLAIILAIISFHEMGHSISSKIVGCSYKMMLFSPAQMSDAQITCPGQPAHKSYEVMAFSGLILTTLISVFVFLLSKKGAIKYFAAGAFSIGVIASAMDLAYLRVNSAIITIIISLAYLLLAFATMKISTVYFKENKEEMS